MRTLLERLAAQPLTFVCVLLAANAVPQPYLGIAGDARLYAAQISERVKPGTFAEDLYLRYGSQERYSIYTMLIAPIVAVLGLEATFFLGYLVSKAILYWGALRLFDIVIRDRAVTALSLLFIAIIPLPFGGNEIFQVNEAYLTPRLSACALVLLGLERMLLGRPWSALALLAGAMLLHPLMAVSGVLVFLAWSLANRLSGRQQAWGVAVGGVIAGAMLLDQPLGRTLFGHMDEVWSEITLQVCFFIRPDHWSWGDWGRIAWSALVVSAAALGFVRGSATFLLSVLGVAVLGVVASAAATHYHYLLLIQASPYRALWLLEFLAIPLAFRWSFDSWRRGTPVACCFALFCLLTVTSNWNSDTIAILGLFTGCLLCSVPGYRGLAASPRRPDWLFRSSLFAFVTTVVLLFIYDVGVLGALYRIQPAYDLDLHPVLKLQGGSRLLCKLPLLIVLLYAGDRCLAWLGSRWCLRFALVAFSAGYQITLIALAQSDWYGSRYSLDYQGSHFINAYLQEQPADSRRRFSVYWPTDLGDVWFTTHANSYFNLTQLSGCAFSRATATEGKSRAELVRLFEIDNVRRLPRYCSWWQEAHNRFYHVESDTPPPSAADLLKLCADHNLDFIILENKFDGLYSATNGRYYIYDCKRLRALTSARS